MKRIHINHDFGVRVENVPGLGVVYDDVGIPPNSEHIEDFARWLAGHEDAIAMGILEVTKDESE